VEPAKRLAQKSRLFQNVGASRFARFEVEQCDGERTEAEANRAVQSACRGTRLHAAAREGLGNEKPWLEVRRCVGDLDDQTST
jgi:hypothetical protein